MRKIPKRTIGRCLVLGVSLSAMITGNRCKEPASSAVVPVEFNEIVFLM